MIGAWSGRPGTYQGISQGTAQTPEGGTFRVIQSSGVGVYNYTVTGGVAVFTGVSLYGPGGAAIQAIRNASVSSALADLICHGWGTNGWEWDGRVVPNEVAAADPTLNLVPDPFNPVDEDAGSTPARSINDAGITDPDGGHNAMKATFTAQQQQLALININDDVLPTDSYVVRGQFQLQSGGSAFRIGGTSTNKTDFTADGNWSDPAVTKVSLSGFANAVNLGFSSATGNTDGVLGAYNLQMFDPLAGSVYPSAATEMAGMDFHAKRPSAYKQSLAIDQYGALDCTTETDGITVYGPPDRVTLTEYAFGCWINCTSEPTTTAGIAFGFDFHTSGATGPNHGQVGVTANNSSSYDRFGMYYGNPGLSTTTAKTGHYLVGEGWQHLAVSVDNGVTTHYINGVPIVESDIVAWTDAVFSKLLLASYGGISRRRKITQHFPGYVQGWWFMDRAATQAEITQQDAHGLARFAAIGDTRVGRRKMAVFGACDSITAFGPSYFWHLTQDRTLSPRLHAMLEAVGGSSLADWVVDPRKAFFKRQIQAACDAGYEKVLLLFLAGANDAQAWGDGTYPLATWITDFTAHIAELKAIDSRVECAVLTMVPRAGAGGLAYSAGSLNVEQKRQEWNDYARANYVAMGFTYRIETGLGTERIDGSGVVTAETIPGGTVRGNYRNSAGAITYSANPAATITLSALSGSSFTATAAAGTFTSQDVGRKVSAGTGVADITAVNSGGSVATLSTAGYAPTGYPSEPAGSVTRDTITRTAFDALSYTSGNWTVSQSDFLWLNDGTHTSEAGGRWLCDLIVSPAIAAIQNAI